MPWARVDDDFEGHPKVQALLNDERGAAAIGLWTLCLSWAHKYTRKPGKTLGLVPPNLPRRYLGPTGLELAGLLVKEGMWVSAGDDGWLIHDFEEYLPSEEMSRARAEAGRKGGLAKAANKAKLASSQEDVASSQEVLATDLANRKQSPSMGMGTGSSNSTEVQPVREDVLDLCTLLADRIVENGSKRPTITKAWHESCRLLLDKDGRSPAQVRKAIEWSQQDDFWRGHILSMPKLREKYDQLRLAAQRNGQASGKVAGMLPAGVPEHMLRR